MNKLKLKLKLNTDKSLLQLDTFILILKAGIIISFFSCLGEYFFYKNKGWSNGELMEYIVAFIGYVLILIFCLRGLQYEKNYQPHPRKQLINFYVFFITYFTSAVVFVTTFMGRIYGAELYFLAVVNLIFGIIPLFNNKQRLTFLLYTLTMYIIGSLLVLKDTLVLGDIGKAIGINVLTFIIGKKSWDWFNQIRQSTLTLHELSSNQRENIQYLADQMKIEVGDLSNIQNANQLNTAVNTLLQEFINSKRDLEDAIVAAEEANEAKESFFSSMSHEIRTPLNAIIGMIRELSNHTSESNPCEYLKNLEIAANHLLAIVNNILDINRLESRDFQLNEKSFSLTSVINDLLSIMHSKLLDKGNNISLKIDPNISDIYEGDMVRLRQILFNIIGNAIKFTENGDIDVEVNRLLTTNEHERVSITVKDSGVGIGQEFLEKIFEKYTQENQAKGRAGSGLGLSITRELVKLMDGNIRIESSKDKGTTVHIDLLLKHGREEDVVKINPIDLQSFNLKGTNVLLVDDDKINRMIARKSLERVDANVIEARDGVDAITKVQAHHIDLILMDIQMPNMDGLEATLKLRNDIGYEGAIIALTANAFSSDLKNYIQNGMDDFITKPYDETTFYTKIENALSQD